MDLGQRITARQSLATRILVIVARLGPSGVSWSTEFFTKPTREVVHGIQSWII
jgi:hypothetical protein